MREPNCRCVDCGHMWASRIKSPKICPNIHCHSVYWNIPRTKKETGDAQ